MVFENPRITLEPLFAFDLYVGCAVVGIMEFHDY